MSNQSMIDRGMADTIRVIANALEYTGRVELTIDDIARSHRYLKRRGLVKSSIVTVDRHIRELKERGYLVNVGRRGRRVVFTPTRAFYTLLAEGVGV